MTEMDSVTRAVYDYIIEYRRKKGYPPTLREIAEGCYIAHSTIYHHLGILEGLRWIFREYNTPRGIQIGENAPDYEAPEDTDDTNDETKPE